MSGKVGSWLDHLGLENQGKDLIFYLKGSDATGEG